MTKLIPLDAGSALLIDGTSNSADLYACAAERIDAARRLMRSLAQTSPNATDGEDFNALCCAVSLLLNDGYAVLEVVANRGTFD